MHVKQLMEGAKGGLAIDSSVMQGVKSVVQQVASQVIKEGIRKGASNDVERAYILDGAFYECDASAASPDDT